MPVTSKKQGQGQTGKKQDDATVKTSKTAGKTSTSKEQGAKGKDAKK